MSDSFIKLGARTSFDLYGEVTSPAASTDYLLVGQPAGAKKITLANSGIAEYGTNANGGYVRFYNGVQVCWNDAAGEIQTSSVWGNIYISSLTTWSFPAAFTTAPSVQHGQTSSGTTSGTAAWVMLQEVNTTSAKYHMASAFSNGYRKFRGLAIGRWY